VDPCVNGGAKMTKDENNYKFTGKKSIQKAQVHTNKKN